MSEALTSTRPYMIRAWHEWCSDNGLTPYLLVKVDHTVAVPREFVQDGEIVLNVGMDATGGLSLGNDEIRFKARFSGKVREIIVPVERVQAIYARETGQGMGFEVLEQDGAGEPIEAAEVGEAATPAPDPAAAPRAGLSVVGKSEAEGPSDAGPGGLPAAAGAAAAERSATEKAPVKPGKGSTLRVVK